MAIEQNDLTPSQEMEDEFYRENRAADGSDRQ
jgi:hypothetical protein